MADFRSSLQAMVARQPTVSEPRGAPGRGKGSEGGDEGVPMSHTVVTGSGLRFELSGGSSGGSGGAPVGISCASTQPPLQRSASVIESALDDDFLDSLLDGGPQSSAPPSLPAFLSAHGLAAHGPALGGLGVGSVDELFEVSASELAQAGLAPADVRALQAALSALLLRED